MRTFVADRLGWRISCEYPPFERFIIRPQIPPANLEWVECMYDSVRGQVRSPWHREGSAITMELKIPGNSKAEVHVPAREHVDVTLLDSEQADRAMEAGQKGGRAVFDLPPGQYRLRVNE